MPPRRQARDNLQEEAPKVASVTMSTACKNQQVFTSTNSKCLVVVVAAVVAAIVCSCATLAESRITFEKMTNRDYAGVTYYTIQNVSLFECLGWCKEDGSCTSAAFSFVVNPFAALQETTCQLQNETQARQTAYTRQMANGEPVTVVAHPQKATNLYFFNKIELNTDQVCSRLWAFERFPNRRLRQRERNSFHSSSKEACQAACMREQSFVCRSLEYNYLTQQCSLNGHDRRSPLIIHLSGQHHHQQADLVEAPGTDYFENACLLGEDICNDSRVYDYAKLGLPLHRVAHFVELNYYPDKEMLVKSQAGCVRACTIEHEFICRSILYRSSFKQGQPNCALYHLDQRTFPDGADTFMSHVMQPLLDSGETSAVYLEAICNDTSSSSTSLQPERQVGSTLSTSASSISQGTTTITMPPTSITIMPSSPSSSSSSSSSGNGLGSHLIVTPSHHNFSVHLERDQDSRFTSTLSPLSLSSSSVSQPTTVRLPTTLGSLPPNTVIGPSGQLVPGNIQIPDLGQFGQGPAPKLPLGISISSSSGQTIRPPSNLFISPAPPMPRDPMLESSLSSSNSQVNSNSQASNHDQNCDAHGFCYDVTLKCTDTKMVVNVKTQRPFHGRIYALGRSETCNANIKNQNQFQLDMYLTGQDCNTQSASGTYTNTIVLQHHNVVLTKADKVYHVRCTYETASRNVSFGMMPVKDMFEVDVGEKNQETISITASSDAPLPKINILTLDGKEASTVRIGDRLTFRIEIPDNTPYGIFARSCIAMAKDARSTFEIIDEHGCPVDHTIFPNFLPVSNGNALESNYEAFRFTESYGVIFQCNVKYCIGKCEPVNCGIGGRETVEAWGRKKRSIGLREAAANGSAAANGKPMGDDMTLSREIVVLDLKDKPAPEEQDSPSPDSGAQRLKAGGEQEASNQIQVTDTSKGTQHCLSSQSLFVLICSIGSFFVAYVCVVAYFFARRDPKISPIKHQYN